MQLKKHIYKLLSLRLIHAAYPVSECLVKAHTVFVQPIRLYDTSAHYLPGKSIMLQRPRIMASYHLIIVHMLKQ